MSGLGVGEFGMVQGEETFDRGRFRAGSLRAKSKENSVKALGC